MSTFQTVKKHTEILYKDKASKFIAYVFPIESEEDFKNELQKIKEIHPACNHHCYAFRLGINGELYRYSDDGEPNNSAGKPMYGQLLSFEVTNVGAVVARYFGGTKLGVGGLISAYKESTKLALEANQIITTELQQKLEINYTYDETSKFNQMVSQFDLEIKDQKFEANCTAIALCKLSNLENLELYLTENQFDYKLINN